MNYPVGMGTTQLAESYGGILGLPVTFVIGRDGHIAAKYVGLTDTGTIQQKVESLQQKNKLMASGPRHLPKCCLNNSMSFGSRRSPTAATTACRNDSLLA